MGRWGHDRDDDTDGKPLKHLVLAARAKTRVRIEPTRKPEKEEPEPRTYDKASGIKLKDYIRELVLDDDTLTPQEIAKKIDRSHGEKVSVVTISNIKSEFRATLKFLKTRELLKNATR